MMVDFARAGGAGRQLARQFGENEDMPRKEVYCETCGSDQPMLEHEPQKDELNPYPWYDISCGTCYSVIATIQIVPDDKPIEPSRAVEAALPLVRGRKGGTIPEPGRFKGEK
jgi:hypothetical protein